MTSGDTSTCSACGTVYGGHPQQCPACGAQLSRDLPEVRPGDVLEGKYEILSLLGTGGMGQVFKARHIHLNAFRTIKVMRRSLLLDEGNRNRFVREARLATLVHHQNVALVHDFASLPDGTHYMVSEFIDGITIRQWERQNGPFPLPLALQIALQALSGLEKIHAAGLLHRDVSADNIMITRSDEGEPLAKIIDLGIAKQLAGPTLTEATQAGLFVGNPRYSSPEQLGALAEGEDLDCRADLYCFGIVLYEMLAGVPPFVATTPHGYAVKHLTESAPPLRSFPHIADISTGLQSVILRALEKQRERRYATAREFGLALAPYATETTEPHRVTARAEPLMPTIEIPHGEFDGANLTSSDPHAPEGADFAGAARGGEIQTVETRLRVSEEIEQSRRAARERDEAWQRAQQSGTRSALESFIAGWPHSREANDARERIGELELLDRIASLAVAHDAPALRHLSDAHPEGRVGTAARDALRRLDEESRQQALAEREAHDWREAMADGSQQAWNRFLAAHPDSAGAPLARLAAEEAREFDEAGAWNTPDGWRAFVAKWPEGRFRPAAEERLRIAEQQRAEFDYERAVRASTLEEYGRFLAEHPASPHAAEIRGRWTAVSELEDARRTNTIAGWRALIAKYPDEPMIDEARKRLRDLERQNVQEFEAALAERSAARLRTLLHREPSPFMSELSRRALDEVTALLTAVRAASAEAIHRFQRHYPESRFHVTVEYLLARLEESSFSLILQTRSRARATKFLTDFPTSAKRPNVQRLLVAIDEEELLRRATHEIGRGNREPAQEALAKITDPQLHHRLRDELARYDACTPLQKAQRLAAYSVATLAEQSRAGIGTEGALTPTPATVELRHAKDEIVAELKELESILTTEAHRFDEPSQPAPAPAPVRTERPVARATPAAAPLPEPKPSRVGPVIAGVCILLIAAATGFWLLRRDSADALVQRGVVAARSMVGEKSPAVQAPRVATTGVLAVDALPWGRIVSLQGGGREWIAQGATTFTPASFTLPPGSYSVTVAGPDDRERTTAVRVTAGTTSPVVVPFERASADRFLTGR
jgi:serine/threonine protein kinase